MKTLASWIVRDEGLTDVDAAGWIIRLARTLEPIHVLGVAHGNITADAIQIEGAAPTSRGWIVVPRHLRDQAAYHSPERASGEGASTEDDTWAAAVLLYVAIARSLPFPGADDREVRRRILGSPAAPLAAAGVNDEHLQRIFDRAFSRDILERITSLRELREALEGWHPDPFADDLPSLDHEGSLLLALCPAPAPVAPAPPPPAEVPRARVPVIHAAEDTEEEDAPTRVRDVSMLLADLAVLKMRPKSEPPLDPGPGLETETEPPPTPVAPRAMLQEVAPVSARILPFERESAPGPPPAQILPERISVPDVPERISAPVLPFQRDSIAGEAPPPPPARPTEAAAQASVAPPRRVEPEAGGRSRTPLLAAGLGLAVVCGVAAFFLLRPGAPSGGDPSGNSSYSASVTAPSASVVVAPSAAATTGASAAASAEPSAAVTASAEPTATASAEPSAAATATASAEPTTTASAEPSASATASASAAASAEPSAAATAAASAEPTATASVASGGAAACMMPLFASGTFASPPAALEAACQITDPRKGVELVKTEVVVGGAGRLVSDGMREWAIMGWYGMGAFAILRSTCCPSAPELRIPFKVPGCDIEAAMKDLAAAVTSKTATDDEVKTALEAYTKAAKCTSRAGAVDSFGQKGPIQEGELVTVQKTITRARAAAKKK